MALKNTFIEYNINKEDMWCSEKFINITIKNKQNVTTDDIKNRPIINENGRVIGMLLEADDEHIYGYVYSLSEIYKRKDKDFSFVVSKGCIE